MGGESTKRIVIFYEQPHEFRKSKNRRRFDVSQIREVPLRGVKMLPTSVEY